MPSTYNPMVSDCSGVTPISCHLALVSVVIPDTVAQSMSTKCESS